MRFLRKFLLVAALALAGPAIAQPLNLRVATLQRKALPAVAPTVYLYNGNNNSGASRTIGGVTTAAGATYPDNTLVVDAYPDLAADLRIFYSESTVDNTQVYVTGGQIYFGGHQNDTLLKTLSTPDFSISIKVGASFGLEAIWDRIDRSTYTAFRPVAGDGAHFLLSNSSGTFSQYQDWGRAIVTGDVVGMRRSGGQLYVSLNGAAIYDTAQPSQTHNNVVGLRQNSGGTFDDLVITPAP